MASSMFRFLGRVPTPIFGSAETAANYVWKKASATPRFAGWAAPGVFGVLWFVWPAVDDEFKMSLGFLEDPEADKKAAEAAAEAAKPVELSNEALKAVAVAHIPHGHAPPTEEEKEWSAMAARGDYSHLEKEWEVFAFKAITPGEDDDDDDDDDDDEDEEEEEEEEEDDDE
mmetsp:Transcript_5880/g.8655  ORF Transcript_5880/g.8655 Transcript_5880/m.8655 type:complete len:171 (+) Transcript_5880:58-570(+)